MNGVFLWLLVGLASGIWVMEHMRIGHWPALLFSLGVMVISWLIGIAVKGALSRNCAIIVFSMLFFFCGFIRYGASMNSCGRAVRFADSLAGEKVSVDGIIQSIEKKRREDGEWSYRFVLADPSVTKSTGERINIHGKLLAKVSDGIGEPLPGYLFSGDGRLLAPDQARNPGAFNYRRYLAGRGIYHLFYCKSEDTVINPSDGFPLARMMHHARFGAASILDRFIKGVDNASLVKGLITGEKGGIPDEITDSFAKSGIIHILAVSGLHVGLIALSAISLFSAFRVRKPLAAVLTVSILILYTVFTGSRVSVIRAATMFSMLLLAPLAGRKPDPYNSLAVVAFFVLAIRPAQLFDAGFQLSFAAAGGIILACGARGTGISKKNDGVVSRWILKPLKVSLSAQLATIPILIHHFGRFSLISPLVNLLVLPVTGILVPSAMLLLSVSPLAFLAERVGAEVNLLAAIIIRLSDTASRFPSAEAHPLPMTGYATLAYYSTLLVIAGPVWTAGKKALISSGFGILFIVISLQVIPAGKNDMKITFLDVGQGDCAVVSLPTGETWVIDSGTRHKSFDYGEAVVKKYLNRNGVKKIDLLFCSHTHNDHYGGLQSLVESFDIELFVTGDTLQQGWTYGELLSSIEEEGCQVVVPSPESPAVFAAGSCTATVWNPAAFEGRYSTNDKSLTVRISMGRISFLLPGDLELKGSRLIINSAGESVASTVLKAPHHGSETSSAIEFLQVIKPEAVVISCGKWNRFGHPDSLVVMRFEELGVEVFRTDREGAILMATDGNILQIETQISGRVSSVPESYSSF